MKKGMNPEAVDQMSERIGSAGEEVTTAFQQVLGKVEALDWTGEDRDRFVSEFSGQLQELANQVRQGCDEFADRGRKNAAKQRDASA